MTEGAAPHDESGFTLAELLIAIAVSAVVLGMVAGGIRLATRVNAASASLERSAALAAARHTLEECIEGALPVSQVDRDGQIRLAFAGASDSIELVCSMGEPRHLLLRIRSGQGGRDLVLAAASFSQHAGERTTSTHLLVEDIAGLSIRYFGEELDGQGARWRDAWSGEGDGLPALVGLSIGFAGGDRRRWPELIVRPRAEPL